MNERTKNAKKFFERETLANTYRPHALRGDVLPPPLCGD